MELENIRNQLEEYWAEDQKRKEAAGAFGGIQETFKSAMFEKKYLDCKKELAE